MRGRDLPKRIDQHGKSFKLTVFRIESFDEDGLPENCTLVPDDRTIELSQDKEKNQLMLCYVPVVMLRKKGAR